MNILKTGTSWKTAVATCAALAAFAANSLLCRRALGADLIDASSFTAVRLSSGALVLVVIVGLRRRAVQRFSRSLASAVALFLYALAFSLAYRSIPAGVGALILFGSVQATMIGSGLARGERPGPLEWVGLVMALAGLCFLVLGRDTSAPPWEGALLMMAAGVAWGVYSLRGRGVVDPIAATAGNFLLAAPLALTVCLLTLASLRATTLGLVLAAISGGVTSGLGYVVWYLALPGLSATRAALVQLAVPIVTALAAALWLPEPITARLVVAAVLVLGGIGMATLSRTQNK